MFRKLTALAALGVAAYNLIAAGKRRSRRAAFAHGQGDVAVRDAGPGAMRDRPGRWSRTDQASDESFPASDPPATY